MYRAKGKGEPYKERRKTSHKQSGYDGEVVWPGNAVLKPDSSDDEKRARKETGNEDAIGNAGNHIGENTGTQREVAGIHEVPGASARIRASVIRQTVAQSVLPAHRRSWPRSVDAVIAT